MRDPHVVSLLYRAITDENVAFNNPPPVENETEAFQMRLADGILTFEMKEHFTSEQEARKLVEPYLRAWEISSALHFWQEVMRFEFENAEVIDRNPSPRTATLTNVVGSMPTLTDIRGINIFTHYPEPPDRFVVSPDVETMWHRFEAYRAGRESLAVMGYMCLTVLQASAGGRKEAAKQYGINFKVLGKLGILTTTVGDERTARKALPNHQFRPHTEAEILWIETVINRLIRRAGEWAYDPNAARHEIRMVDLPKI